MIYPVMVAMSVLVIYVVRTLWNQLVLLWEMRSDPWQDMVMEFRDLAALLLLLASMCFAYFPTLSQFIMGECVPGPVPWVKTLPVLIFGTMLVVEGILNRADDRLTSAAYTKQPGSPERRMIMSILVQKFVSRIKYSIFTVLAILAMLGGC